MKKFLIPFFVIINFIPATHAHAEGAGIRLNYKNFVINATYNDNAEDKITGVEYIRDPDGLLFDLIKIIQENKDVLAKSDTKISIDIGNYNRYLFITQKKPTRKDLVDVRDIKHLDKNLILDSVCKSITGKECMTSANDTTFIYLSTLLLSSSSSDLIEFGCFPCDNDRSISLSDRFIADQPNEQTPKFKKVMVDRQSIYHYFNKLRD